MQEAYWKGLNSISSTGTLILIEPVHGDMPYGEENFKVAVLIYPNSFDSVVSVIFLIVESDG